MRDFLEDMREISSSKFPFKWFRRLFVIVLKLKQSVFNFDQVVKIVWRQNFALHHREIDFDLVEPAGMNGSMNLNRVRIPLGKPFDRCVAAMRRSVVRYPEDTPGRAVWLLSHDQIHQAAIGVDSGGFLAQTEDFRASNVPGSHVCQGARPLIFKLQAAMPAGNGRCSGVNALAGLNAGFFIRAENKIIVSQGFSLPQPLIKVQNNTGFFSEMGVAWKNPDPMRPRLDRVSTEPAPDGGTAD